MDKMDNQELISALADGQLQGEALAHGVEVAATDEGRRTWRSYCVIGEVLRAGHAPAGTPPEAFLARLQARLREEALPAPRPVPVPAKAAPREAANDFGWKLAAGFASVAAVAAVGWNLFSTAPAAGPQLAKAPAAAVPVAADARAMIRDPRLDQLLQAHRQLGGATALPTTGFLRNATFEGPAR